MTPDDLEPVVSVDGGTMSVADFSRLVREVQLRCPARSPSGLGCSLELGHDGLHDHPDSPSRWSDPIPFQRSTTDLVTWLRQVLDDEERVALLLAETAPWSVYDTNARRTNSSPCWALADGHNVELLVIGSHSLTDHIARHDPARVLADVAAKRAIIAYLGEWARVTDSGGMPGPTKIYEWVTRFLAQPYADRPGYRDEWRPA